MARKTNRSTRPAGQTATELHATMQRQMRTHAAQAGMPAASAMPMASPARMMGTARPARPPKRTSKGK